MNGGINHETTTGLGAKVRKKVQSGNWLLITLK